MSSSALSIKVNSVKIVNVNKNPAISGRKDFFFENDKGFKKHKEKLIHSIGLILEKLKSQTTDPIGFLKVSLRKSALAKSHRPIVKLFTDNRTPIVGGLILEK